MKHDINYYRDKYEHGFLHYLRKCNYWESIESSFDLLAEAALNLVRGFFGVIVGLPAFALRASIIWPIARIFEYYDMRRQISNLVEKDKRRECLKPNNWDDE